MFKNQESALKFGQTFWELNKIHWINHRSKGRYALLQRALGEALDQKIISMEDWFTDDEKVMKKIENCDNKVIKQALSDLLEGKLPPENETGPKKNRFVDPCFISKNGLRRVSEVDESFKKLILTSKKDDEKGV